MWLACKDQHELKTNTSRAVSGCTFMCSNKMLLLGAVESSGGKNSHGKNNTFLVSDRSAFAHFVQMLLYSRGGGGEILVGGTFPEKGPSPGQ